MLLLLLLCFILDSWVFGFRQASVAIETNALASITILAYASHAKTFINKSIWFNCVYVDCYISIHAICVRVYQKHITYTNTNMKHHGYSLAYSNVRWRTLSEPCGWQYQQTKYLAYTRQWCFRKSKRDGVEKTGAHPKWKTNGMWAILLFCLLQIARFYIYVYAVYLCDVASLPFASIQPYFAAIKFECFDGFFLLLFSLYFFHSFGMSDKYTPRKWEKNTYSCIRRAHGDARVGAVMHAS